MSFLFKNKSAIRTTESSHASVNHLEGFGSPVCTAGQETTGSPVHNRFQRQLHPGL